MERAICRKCGHIWNKRVDEPRRCPHCTNPKWQNNKAINNKQEEAEPKEGEVKLTRPEEV